MKSMLRTVNDHGLEYPCLMFICPGCAEDLGSGLHMLPVNTTVKEPAWSWDGNLEKPTITPSILTGRDSDKICHSYLKEGIFQFLEDSTHSLAGTFVEIPDLPDWVIDEEPYNGTNGAST